MAHTSKLGCGCHARQFNQAGRGEPVPTMHKKHYQAIAHAFREVSEGASKGELERLERLAYMLADFFASDSENFDRMRFLSESGF